MGTVTEGSPREVERHERLTAINERLTAAGIKPLVKLGDAQKGEIEITALRDIHEYRSPDEARRFYAVATFETVSPSGEVGLFHPRSEGIGPGCGGIVAVTTVNGKFAMVKQRRSQLGGYTFEVPRGFIDLDEPSGRLPDAPKQEIFLNRLAANLLRRELGADFFNASTVRAVIDLGRVAENSGVSFDEPAYYLVLLSADPKWLERPQYGQTDETLRVHFWDEEQVDAEVTRKIRDAHSIVGLHLAARHARRMFKS